VPNGAQSRPSTSDLSRPLSPSSRHRVGVDAQREARVGVPELGHHVGRVLAAHIEDRGERMAWADTPSGNGSWPRCARSCRAAGRTVGRAGPRCVRAAHPQAPHRHGAHRAPRRRHDGGRPSVPF